jgi:hypothetical protein
MNCNTYSANRFTLGRTAALLAIALILFALAIAPPARAEEEPTHFFNAARSLTGNCSKSALDRVEDPGCPGGEHPPLGPIDNPWGVAADSFGDIYVDSYSQATVAGHDTAHIDVFSPEGNFITEVVVPDATRVAVDSTGHMYVVRSGDGSAPKGLFRYDPTAYDPLSEEIAYDDPPVLVADAVVFRSPGATEDSKDPDLRGVAVNTKNDHVFLLGSAVDFTEFSSYGELSSPAEPNQPIAQSKELRGVGSSIVIDGARNHVIINTASKIGVKSEIKTFEATAPFAELGSIDGSTIPGAGKFATNSGDFPITVNEDNGHVFAQDSYARQIFEFETDGAFVARYNSPPVSGEPKEMAYDNWPLSPSHGYLYAVSGETGQDHLFAYEPKKEILPPTVESLSVEGINMDEAVLRATVKPGGLATHYVFEYVTQQSYEEAGNSFEDPTVAGEGDLAAGGEGIPVTMPVFGLTPGTAYRFRVRAENLCEPQGCSDEGEGTFTTFPSYAQAGSCPNQGLRVGLSAFLPDCRAYELVTPPDTHGRPPLPPTAGIGSFGTPPASPSGESLGYVISGGSPPGMQGAGGFNGDAYVAKRTAGGWVSSNAGPLGAESSNPSVGGMSPDLEYAYVRARGDFGGAGSLLINDHDTHYIRYPDGSFHLVGQGEAEDGTPVIDQFAEVRAISAGGSHIIFDTNHEEPPVPQLTPDAPPTGTKAIYERSFDGPTELVSLLPGEITPAAGEHAYYVGASRDGSAIAFNLGIPEQIYLRVDGSETLLAAPPGSKYAGLSADGRYLFYVLGGDLFRFDAEEDETLRITETGDVIPVNASSQGTGAYFISPTALPVGGNPLGDEPIPSGNNLYYWDGDSIRFVAAVTEADVKGEETIGGTHEGLGLWLDAVSGPSPAVVSSRTDPSGTTLMFASRAQLTDYDSGGKAEIYRYSASEESLACLSCDPTGAKAGSDARFLKASGGTAFGNEPGLTRFADVPNLSPDGRRAFFESAERLVPADNDNVIDVYEWEADGKGSCATSGGCLFLISSGTSPGPNLLFGVSQSGDDVFIEAPDLLVPEADQDETYSVYDVRVGGGIPSPPSPPAECLGEACQPAAAAPNDPTPASSAFQGAGNVVAKRCPKRKKLVVRNGSERCVPKHKHRKRHKHRKNTHGRGRAAR